MYMLYIYNMYVSISTYVLYTFLYNTVQIQLFPSGTTAQTAYQSCGGMDVDLPT